MLARLAVIAVAAVSVAQGGGPPFGSPFRLGFPSVFATREELNARTVWDYAMPGPFRSKVIFSGDRVDRYEPPGQLP